jgi:uncharacterized delta-60 repeat protein
MRHTWGSAIVGVGFIFVCTLASLQAGNDNATAIALDNWENVFVTGQSMGFGTVLDFATLKYDSSRNLLWKRRFNGPSSGNDVPYALVVDGPGNVYVTGTARGFGTGQDYATIKYSSGGVPQWVAPFNGSGNGDDIARALAVDGVGNVYVTGSSFSGVGGLDFVTIKYNSAGAPLWTRRWSGPAGEDIARAIKVDAAGNVYVTGSSASVFGPDYLTLKYDVNGNLLWASRYNGPGNGTDIPVGLAIDSLGNVYVTGSSVGSGSGSDYATIKYNSHGIQQWVARFNGPGNFNDQANALALDNSGNILVTGGSYGANGSVLDYLTIKYSSSGAILWTARYNGPVSGNDTATALAVDNTGNVFVTGTSQGLNSAQDYATIKYNSNGMCQWVTRFNGTGNAGDTAVGIALNNTSGNVYVTGSSAGAFGTGPDYATIKYNSSGILQWVARFDGP